ncbi:probable protein phosphatase 2C 63 [Syzygium oleosum]|uniref:probable protein phosphatase 2C 63 n=1 Tax=Syzygium oleosum TaxID=219896 RepID=UPI0011D1A194|nr:probable protein phosphatase 2C 63 [Syzygium oleosum]
MSGSCYGHLERCFGWGGGDKLAWHVDLKPHACGDYSIAAVQANSSLEDQAQVWTASSTTYVGVYDGHGGPEASRFIARSLFPFLHKCASEHGGVSSEIIKKAFDTIEEEFLHFVRQSWPVRPEIASMGSCCLVGVISSNTLYVANLGDSRAVLGRRVSEKNVSGAVVAERLSTDHNVCAEEIRKEVEALHPDDSGIVVNTRGVWRIKGIIQVSRSIGDFYLKRPEFNQWGPAIPLRRPLMTAEPSIVIRELKKNDLFLIFASDGLWEHLTDETAVEIVSKYPQAGIAKRLVRAALQEAARKREIRFDDIKKIKKGIRRHFHDDISVVVVFFDHSHDSRNSRVVRRDNYDSTTVPVDIFSHNADEADC